MVAVGIDLGTTYSCVAYYNKKELAIIDNNEGGNTMPSVVAIDEDGDVTTGLSAKNRADLNPKNIIYSVKRLIGQKFDDPKVQEDIQRWTFEVVSDKNVPKVKVDSHIYDPETISAHILRKLKMLAEDRLGEPVTEAVITVPAYFNEGQRQATKDAGEIAGLKVRSIINEPTAAALAYNHKNPSKELKRILVFDFGGGTFDISVLEMKGRKIKVMAVAGDTHLGGEDIDNILIDFCHKKFFDQYGVHLQSRTDKLKVRRDLRRLRKACEEAKCILTGAKKATVTIDAIHEGFDLIVSFTQQEFDELIQPIVSKCIVIIDSVLFDASIQKTQIQEIVLVGGSSKIPLVQKELRRYFDEKELSKTIRPDEAVAHGAALFATEAEKFAFQDVYPLPIGINVNADGTDDNFSEIIPKNSRVPFERNCTYRTNSYGNNVSIKIYEGESKQNSNNYLLGEFILQTPADCPAGELLKVQMRLSAEGILTVTAVIPKFRKSKKLVIQDTRGRLTNEDIRRLKAEVLETVEKTMDYPRNFGH